MRTSWIAPLLVLALGSCSPSAKQAAPLGPAGDVCGLGPARCAAAGQASCFETLQSLAYGDKVRVISRLSGTEATCPPGRYCQCLSVEVAVGQGESCRQCVEIDFKRRKNGPGAWHTEIYDFNLDVATVGRVEH